MIDNLKEAEDPPRETVACCPVWKDIRSTFSWYAFQDFPEYATMPNIKGWRINYCPSCGAKTRITVWRTN